ncbi:MAG: sensor histidine kinase [bacterium]|nr:sensor histidine kinase [bacterium]
MRDAASESRWRRIEGPGTIALMIVAVSLMHYSTAIHIHEAHGIYRRLYYFPILLAAFRYGRRGGLAAAFATCAFYAPHAFGLIGFDPAFALEKSLEMVLYFAVGLVAGVLVDREHATQRSLRRTLEDRDRMASQLLRSERLAAVGRLSAGLAHEIRNPLASINGAAEVLGDDFPAGHPKARLAAILRDESRRLNDVLTRFLTFARGAPATAAPFDLLAEARAVAELARRGPGTPEVTVDGPVSLPQAIGNPEQVRQVLLNLVLNGLAAAGPGGRIEMQVVAEGETVCCRVLDDGPGFSDEAAANFGTPFFSTTNGGTGLGLATSLRLIEDLGGTLVIDREAGRGCVELRLPAAGLAAAGAPSGR